MNTNCYCLVAVPNQAYLIITKCSRYTAKLIFREIYRSCSRPVLLLKLLFKCNSRLSRYHSGRRYWLQEFKMEWNINTLSQFHESMIWSVACACRIFIVFHFTLSFQKSYFLRKKSLASESQPIDDISYLFWSALLLLGLYCTGYN